MAGDKALMRDPNDHLRRSHRVFLGEERMRDSVELRVFGERHGRGDEVDFLFREHRRHRWELRFDDRDILAIVEVVLAQHRTQPDIHGAAGGTGGDDLAFQILDALDRAVVEDVVFAAVVIADPVLKHIRDDPQIGHLRVLDRKGEGRIGELTEIDAVGAEAGDDGGTTGEVYILDDIGFAVMRHQILLGEADRNDAGIGARPADANSDRLICTRWCNREDSSQGDAGNNDRFHSQMFFHGLSCFAASLTSG